MITKAAMRVYDKRRQIEMCLTGHRHHDILNNLCAMGYQNHIDYVIIEYGFMTSNDTFLSREDAWDEAYKCGQLKWKDHSINDYMLYTEDLW